MPAVNGRGGDSGALAIVLHTHMPYVEGFGTWPFGEEWLWEAMATSYLPLLDVLERGGGGRADVTLSVTPVLADQLEATGIGERFVAFLRDVRATTHALDEAGLREGGEAGLADEVARAAGDYAGAEARFAAIGGDLLGALAPHVGWTSSATHAVLPLVATDAGVRLQVETGIDAHRRRFGGWEGGFWLPECAHAGWLEPLLAEAGVHATCVDLTDVYGPGSREHLTPRVGPGGITLAPIDREVVELVWSDAGYPAHGTYRDYHHHTIHHHRPWSNDGRPYDHDAALALAREHAADFVGRVKERVAGGGLSVCALDTELLGHWWYEGVHWLEAVLDEAARQGLEIVRLDEALARGVAAPLERELPVTTWGTPRDLSTWEGPGVADFAWRARAAELRVVARGAAASTLALRELLALQASDWAFMVTRGLAGPYPSARAAEHAAALDEALSLDSAPARVRNLAPHVTTAPLLVP
jgi:1,4-alpha-glucan branching enzyme